MGVKRIVVVGLLLGLVVAAPVRAQQPPVSVTLGGAVVAPLSGSADNFSTGGGLDFGVTWDITGQMGLKFEYCYSALGAKNVPVPLITTPINVKPRLQFGTAAFVFQAPPNPFRLYVLAGVGLYRRSVSLTTSGTGLVTVCDPWWFVCYPQPVPIERVVGSRSTTDFGVNVGAGFTARHFFAEARYHYMTGPSYSTPSGAQKATGKFFPLVVGVRF